VKGEKRYEKSEGKNDRRRDTFLINLHFSTLGPTKREEGGDEIFQKKKNQAKERTGPETSDWGAIFLQSRLHLGLEVENRSKWYVGEREKHKKNLGGFGKG